MAEIVLRVRLVGGDHLDVTYDETGAAADEVVEHIIATLAQDGGTLRCRHGAGQIARTSSARGPLAPRPTANSTRWFS
jgi:hypothetical protein